MKQERSYNLIKPENVTYALEIARSNNLRVRMWYGNQETGETWLEEHDIMGYVGRSTVIQPCHLLLNNSRSLGGNSILLNSVLAIQEVKTKRFLFKHHNFLVPLLTKTTISTDNTYPVAVGVVKNNAAPDIIARFKTELEANNYIAFMRGERMSKH